MYEFHCGYAKKKWKDVKLLSTETDSLVFEVETDYFFKDISEDVETMYDTSGYPKNHPSGIPTGLNKKVIGLTKDEAGGKIIEEFVGLRSKLYYYKMFKEKEEKKCKGIGKAVIKKRITHDDYKDCLFSGNKQMRKMNVIRSPGHEIFSETVTKAALSCDDDKRFIREDGIST